MLTALLTAIFVVGVLIGKDAITAWWIAQHAPVVAPPPPPEPPTPAAILEAVTAACVAAGLPAHLSADYDLSKAGGHKLYDVVEHAAGALGKDHELRTVQDLCDWLAAAPPTKETPT